MLKRTDDTLRASSKFKSRARAPSEIGNELDLAELPNALGYALRRAQLAAFKLFKETFKAFDITPAQYSVLVVIERNPGLKQNQISDALGIKRANFVLLLNVLESRGLAQRAPAIDRRSYALQITPEGKRLVKKFRSLSTDMEAKLTAPIGAEGRESLLRMLAAISRAAERDK